MKKSPASLKLIVPSPTRKKWLKIMPAFWTIFSLTALFLIIHLITGDNVQAHIRIWYLYGLTAYTIVSLVIIVNTERVLAAQWISGVDIGAIIFFVGVFILNFVIELPLVLRAACTWWVAFSISSTLLVLLILGVGTIYRRQQEEANSAKKDLTLLN